jgi:hypothetical protein
METNDEGDAARKGVKINFEKEAIGLNKTHQLVD